jgi:hypothetical protein
VRGKGIRTLEMEVKAMCMVVLTWMEGLRDIAMLWQESLSRLTSPPCNWNRGARSHQNLEAHHMFYTS